MLINYLKNPKLTGSVISSSTALARAMVKLVPPASTVVELGAGTGPITTEILKQHPTSQLHLFEYDSRMAEFLAREFSKAFVYDGFIHRHAQVLESLPLDTHVYSSLPFKSIPQEVSVKTIELIERFLLLRPQAVFRQYSYFIPGYDDCPFNVSSSLKWRKVATVFKNIPPANVFELTSQQK